MRVCFKNAFGFILGKLIPIISIFMSFVECGIFVSAYAHAYTRETMYATTANI